MKKNPELYYETNQQQQCRRTNFSLIYSIYPVLVAKMKIEIKKLGQILLSKRLLKALQSGFEKQKKFM